MVHYACFIRHTVITPQLLWHRTSAVTEQQTDLNMNLGFQNKCTHLSHGFKKGFSHNRVHVDTNMS